MPLARYRALTSEPLPLAPEPSELPVLWANRRIEGRFHQGLWTGRLVGRFEVLAKGMSRVPILDAQAVLGEVLLGGKPASLMEDGASFSLVVDKPGKYEISVDFHWGRESQRFTRTLRFALPHGGPIEVEARIAEIGITPNLASGALMHVSEEGHETRVVAFLDGSSELGLSWKRNAGEAAAVQARVEAQQNTLFHMTDALVTGRSAFRLRVLSGETDEIALALPPGVEVLRVEGDAVLQWHTTQKSAENRGLVVLLRHLVSDEVSATVDFQLSSEPNAQVALSMPMVEGQTSGAFGIVGPPGLRLTVKGKEGAEELAMRDIPPDLASLAKGPLLLAYRVMGKPRVLVETAPLPELALSRTVVDELSASTVLGEDGLERTKLSLRIRNDGRQYVEMRLPEGAIAKRSFLDGVEVRPALLGQRLLLPLRQSEKLTGDQMRIHIVRAGETLSDVANLYYSDPSAWQRIVAKNRDVVDISGVLKRETRLKIPPARESADEGFFVIEVAYERSLSALSSFGLAALRLPGLDIDTTRAVWHVYMPSSHEPLTFQGNFTQWSRIKYDPFRRLKWYLEAALAPTNAYAGGDYENILQKRRSIYQDEASHESDSAAALTSFPLVGERYRFRRILLGREVGELRVFYASNAILLALRCAALVVVLALSVRALRRRSLASFLALGSILVLLMAIAHYVPGLNSRLVWGVDLALLFVLMASARKRGKRLLRALLRAPWLLTRMVTIRRLIAALGLTLLLGELVHRPMLLPFALLALFSFLYFRLISARKNRRVSNA